MSAEIVFRGRLEQLKLLQAWTGGEPYRGIEVDLKNTKSLLNEAIKLLEEVLDHDS